MAEPLTTQRETEIRQTHPGDWYAGEWKTREVQGTSEEPGTWQVVSDGTALATLPDWAGPIALFIADAHDAVPELLAELARVRAEREKYTLVPHWEYELMEQQRARAEKAEARVAELETSIAPRLCSCGHSRRAHTVPAPHSCFAFGQTCPCLTYQQLPPDGAWEQQRKNIAAREAQAADEAATP